MILEPFPMVVSGVWLPECLTLRVCAALQEPHAGAAGLVVLL